MVVSPGAYLPDASLGDIVARLRDHRGLAKAEIEAARSDLAAALRDVERYRVAIEVLTTLPVTPEAE